MTTAEPDDAANPASEGPDADAFVRALLGEQLAELRAAEPAVRSGHTEAVHAARTAAWRMRSTLLSYEQVLTQEVDPLTLDELQGELRWLGQALSPARDAEVVRARLLDRLATQPAALVLGPVGDRIRAALDDDVTRGTTRAAADLASPRYALLLRAVDSILTPTAGSNGSTTSARDAAQLALERDVDRLLAAVDDADGTTGPSSERDVALHAIRKKAKRLRYSALSGSDVLGRPARRLARATHRIQDALGEHQDAVVAREVLMTLTAEAQAAGEPTFTLGRLHALEEESARAAERAFTSARRRLLRRARPFRG